jgi:hypothetical protein
MGGSSKVGRANQVNVPQRDKQRILQNARAGDESSVAELA